ncbi:MAG: Gfo/Idh/MocA family oxidoreductase [Chloroflexota bacterium]|nr:Gfo/Idh/MocA family oxidoreductase [Chloroflexota bacterium]
MALERYSRAKPLKLALVGCGGMGRRHLHGLAQLESAGLNPFDLVGVCDPFAEAANAAAHLAEKLLDVQPRVYAGLEDLAAAEEPDAVDIVTTPATHHLVGAAALDLGLHVQIEKPVAITISAANFLERAADESGRVLSVAENFRRDPINRLLRAVIDSQELGQPAMMIDTTLSGGGAVVITPWRSTSAQGGLLMDVGVHNADMFEYFMGPVEEITAWAGVLEPQRSFRGLNSNLARFYELSNRQAAGDYRADGVDSGFALLRFSSGAAGQWSMALGVGGGDPVRMRRIYLEDGMIECPDDRSGQPPSIVRRGDRSECCGDAVLGLVPEFELPEVTAHLFGGNRFGRIEMGFNEIDARITASEYWELGDCILNNKRPEVGITEGRAALAVVLGAIESGLSARSVKVSDLLEGRVSAYQDRLLPESPGPG